MRKKAKCLEELEIT